MANHKFEPTEEDREKVKLLACVGTRQNIICRMIVKPDGKPITEKTLRKYFDAELELGLAEANAMVGQTCFDMATSGLEPGMTAFWLKCRAGWRETSVTQTQQLDKDGKPVNPAPMFGVSFENGGPGQVESSGGPPQDPSPGVDAETGTTTA